MSYEVKDFNKDIIEKSFNKPVLVDFWAEWCGPCRILGPILEKLAAENKNEWELVKVDTDRNQEAAVKYGIRGIPNVKLFKDGKVINEFTGALPESAVREWLKKSIPGKFAAQIEKAKVLLKKGDLQDAKTILEEVYRGDINNNEVKTLLAKIFLFEDYKESLKLLEGIDFYSFTNGSSEMTEIAESVKTIALLFDRNPESFPEADVKEKYISAVNDLRIKNFNSALEKFIDIIRNNRSYDDDGARKNCIAIFKYLGEENEITLKYRRDFGSALYV